MIKYIAGTYKFEIYLKIDEKQSTIFQSTYTVKEWIDNSDINNKEVK